MKNSTRWILSLLCSTSVIPIASATSPLTGTFDPGFDIPYLWDSNAGYTNPDWMDAVADQKLLSEISIPGTHSSMALYGGNGYQTQTLTVEDQLDMGVRYLDARLVNVNGTLQAYNGIAYQYQTFNEFLSTVSLFLDANPSETVLIRVIDDGGIFSNPNDFYQAFTNDVSQYSANNIVPVSDNPTLGDVRGKFVIVQDFNTLGNRVGIDIASTNKNDHAFLLTEADLYSTWANVKSHFDTITSANISLNYLSGFGGVFPYFVSSGKVYRGSHDPQLWTGLITSNSNIFPDFPRDNCLGSLCKIFYSGTNLLTDEKLGDGLLPDNLGVVVMNFPGGGLVDKIILNNALDGFVLYDNTNQQGSRVPIFDEVADLGTIGFNDRMESWNIPPGWQVRFYEDVNFQGAVYTRDSNSDVNATGFENVVSSVEILQRDGFTLYDDTNQQGDAVGIFNDEPDLAALNFNDLMESWRIPLGWQVRFYEDANYQGAFYTRDSNSDVNATGFENLVSSVEILQTEGFILYDDTNQQGNAVAIFNDEPDLSTLNFDNLMESWSIPLGWVVRFYEDANFQGAFYSRDSNSDINATGFESVVSSVEILQTEGFILYDDANQQGDAVAIFNDVADLGTLNFDDMMESWSIPAGWEVRFYEDVNFQGGEYTRDSSSGVNATGFNNTISSVRILSTP